MSPCHPFRPVPGQCGPNRRGPLPAPPFDPRDYWATRKCVSRLSASLETKLDKADVVDPGAATEAGKAADAKSTYEELNGVLAKLAKKADKTALDDKRDKDDRAVYKLVKSAFVLHKDGLTDITLPFIGKAQDKPYPYSEYDWVFEFEGAAAFSAIVFSDGQWKLNVEDGAEYGYSSASEDALRIEFDNGYVATRSSIISTVPVDDQQLASVATGDAQTPANGDLVKYDSANDRFVKAIAGTDYIPLVEDYNGQKTAVTIGSRARGQSVGVYSLANGIIRIASGDYSHAEGLNTDASGDYSHAEGSVTSASGNYSHAEGSGTVASGYCSHAEGSDTSAPGYCSHAEGSVTSASGDCSHAEGSGTSASGDYSHAEGSGTVASGRFSHAEGVNALTHADDRYAYAWNGDGDRTNSYISHGPGTFNINPVGGLSGFWIGEQTLTQVINAVIAERLSAVDPDNASVYDLIKALKGE